MHIHSTHSDGRASPKDILLYAMYRELKVISITDHDTFQGSVVASRYAREKKELPLVIIGSEVRSERGDILLYCFEPIDFPRKIDQLIDYAHENNCLVVPAHPFDAFRAGIGEALYEYSGWDGVEVWNSSSSLGANKKAIRASRELGLPGLANSDAHIPDYIGVAYTLLDVEELSVEAVFKAIKNNRVRPYFGYPPFKVFLKRIAWSIERLFMKKKP
ncbi:MAG: histidinol-phosphatase [Desulfurococcales archaeon ex4484_58]|nr:MAG: histidinol-phosphatase [Desulfurococcales archaeon ex4484_58]